jgi:hypothetical protein
MTDTITDKGATPERSVLFELLALLLSPGGLQIPIPDIEELKEILALNNFGGDDGT